MWPSLLVDSQVSRQERGSSRESSERPAPSALSQLSVSGSPGHSVVKDDRHTRRRDSSSLRPLEDLSGNSPYQVPPDDPRLSYGYPEKEELRRFSAKKTSTTDPETFSEASLPVERHLSCPSDGVSGYPTKPPSENTSGSRRCPGSPSIPASASWRRSRSYSRDNQDSRR